LRENVNKKLIVDQIPEKFKRVVVGIYSDLNPSFVGVEFYDSQGRALLSFGMMDNPVETILDDDERIVGIASRNESGAEHRDF
jgi:hypothetical protein